MSALTYAKNLTIAGLAPWQKITIQKSKALVSIREGDL
jgi:hypothetical protein